MVQHSHISDKELLKQIKEKKILFGGNLKLKIFGILHCKSGKRMKKENRIFFSSEQEARKADYRPCGHCLHKDYKNWKLHGPI